MRTGKLLIALSLLSFSLGSYAGTFTSNVAAGNYNLPASWTVVGDADGIPDDDDDITILSGHNISLATYSNSCKNLTISAGGTLSSSNLSFVLYINGDYTNSGTETGVGTFLFKKVNGVISGIGSFGSGIAWQFSENTSLSANVNVIKNVKCRIKWGTTVTNNGTFRLNTVGQMVGDSPSSKWVNAAGSNLIINSPNFMSVGIKDFSSTTNTLNLAYNSLGLNMFSTVGGLLGNLTVSSGIHNATMVYTVQGNLSVSGATGRLNIGNNDFHLYGNLTNSATITIGTSNSFFFDGGGAQAVGAGTIALSNVVIDNGSTVSHNTGTISISNSLTLTNGDLTIAGAATFNLLSDAATTAIIASCGVGASITGNVNINRYIDARSAGYSDVSASTTSGTFADWDDDNTMVYVYSPPSYYPSAWGYDETAWDYVPITSSSTAMTPGVGFEMYLDSDGSQTSWAATTVDLVGTPNIGDVDMSSYVTNSNDGWNLVGNPYHANIDWDALYTASSGISTDIMFYDETISDFITVSTGSGVLIAPEQGFWVQVLGAPSFTFTENIKSTSNSSTFRKPAQELFGIRLKNESGIQFTSGTHFRFDENPITAQKGDLNFKKLPHPQAPALYSLNNKYGLKIKLLNSTNSTIEIPLGMQINVSGQYSISPEFVQEAINQGYNCIQLIDHKSNTITNLTEEAYQFYADEGKDESRFSLKLSKDLNCNANVNSLVEQVSISRLGENAVVKFNFNHDTNVKLTITNTIGQELIPAQIIIVNNEQKSYTLPSDFEGIFMVNIWVDGKIISKKLFK